MRYCASCGGFTTLCECPGITCNAASNPDEEGKVLHCERQLHHRGRCAKRLPDGRYVAWQESALDLLDDLGIDDRYMRAIATGYNAEKMKGN